MSEFIKDLAASQIAHDWTEPDPPAGATCQVRFHPRGAPCGEKGYVVIRLRRANGETALCHEHYSDLCNTRRRLRRARR
jgi:hypothetical protein